MNPIEIFYTILINIFISNMSIQIFPVIIAKQLLHYIFVRCINYQ